MVDKTAGTGATSPEAQMKFVENAATAYSLMADFYDKGAINPKEFAGAMVEDGLVESELVFILMFFLTRKCFDRNDNYIAGVHPEKFKFDKEETERVLKCYIGE